MKYFIVALQFLTRIHIKNQPNLNISDFGTSMAYFPFIGLIIGLVTALPQLIVYLPSHPAFSALIAIFAHYFIIGGLHADAFMDTCDGLFSNRNRERKLEIMKDSCIGANALTGFIFLVLLKWQSLTLIPPVLSISILIIIAIFSKFGMVRSVLKYPYARKEGMGKAFVENAPSATYLHNFFAMLISLFIVILLNLFLFNLDFVIYLLILYLILFVVNFITNILLNRYCTKHLGGVTGDTYGFVSECSELTMLLTSAFYVMYIF